MPIILSPMVVLRAEPHYFHEYIAYNSRTWETVRISPEQYEVLRLLASEPADEIDVFSRLENCGTVSGKDLVEKGILIYASQPVPRASVPRRGAHPVVEGIQCLSAPSLVEMCITRRCNEACFHCNVSARSQSGPESQPISFWLGMVDRCVEAGVLKVTITGGEPFIRKDFDLLLEKLSRAPLSISILTNGLDISDHQIDVLQQANISLGISLDGADPHEHDAFRRTPGAFDRTVAVMKRLGDAGVCFTVSVTVHSGNLDQLPQLIDIATAVRARAIVFGPMGGVGRGATPPARQYHPSAHDVWSAMENIIELAKHRTGRPDIIVARYEEREIIEFQNGKIKLRRPPGLCKAGIFALAIDEDGIVYPCLRGLQSRIHPIGNAALSSLQELWHSHVWSQFRNNRLQRVPCRVEAIEASQRENAALAVLN
jgi:MoaA/NifB/PqqE/SkfB family radical SAM enzyme